MKYIIILKALVAFFIPFLAGLAGALQSYKAGSPTAVEWVIIAATTLGAGFSGLGSFVSTSFAQHKAEVAALNNSQLTPLAASPTLAPSKSAVAPSA